MDEYKEWLRKRQEENKELIKRFPYLAPDNWADSLDEFDYSFTKMDECPEGWRQLCETTFDKINEVLFEKGVADYFYVLEVKEKFNGLRIYYSFNYEGKDYRVYRAIEVAEYEIEKILDLAESKSHFLCQCCGRPIPNGIRCALCLDNAKIVRKNDESIWCE